MLDIFKNIEQPQLSSREKVLDLEVNRLEKGYKIGWLYFQCKEQELLQVYYDIEKEGSFDILRNGSNINASSFVNPKLSIELVPRSSWFNNVRSEVTKVEWDSIKSIIFKKARYCCEICGKRGAKWPVECHEIWHYDDKQKIQSLKGFIALCPSCHEVKHAGLAELKGKGAVAAAHLAIINKWKYFDAKKYIKMQFDIWEERSEHSWLLDVKLLEDFGIRLECNVQKESSPYVFLRQVSIWKKIQNLFCFNRGKDKI